VRASNFFNIYQSFLKNHGMNIGQGQKEEEEKELKKSKRKKRKKKMQ